MKNFTLILLSFFILSGCAFLKGKTSAVDQAPAEESLLEEGAAEFLEEEDGFASAEGEEGEDGYADEEDEEYADEDDEEYADEDDEEYDDEYADEDDEAGGEYAEGGEDEEEGGYVSAAKKSGGLKGFFQKLLGFSDEEPEQEASEEFEGDTEFIGESGQPSEEDRDYTDYEEMDEQKEASAEEEDSSKTESAAVDVPEEYLKAPDLPKDSSLSESFAPPAQAEAAKPAATPVRSFIPLRKIIASPYKKAGYLVNAVYIARPDDTLESISEKIYGARNMAGLRKINTHLASRPVKVGDKIYYNSPNRPKDSARLLFYYQDIQAPSAVYNLSPGDNIRKVSARLLGHPDSWKEIWATNPDLESKGDITRSLSIAYWPKEASKPAEIQAAAEEPPSPPPAPEEPFAEQPASEGLASADDSSLQLEGPGDRESLQPPAPVEQPPSYDLEEGKADNMLAQLLNNKELLAGIALIIILLLLIIRLIVKKRRQRDFDYTASNIEI